MDDTTWRSRMTLHGRRVGWGVAVLVNGQLVAGAYGGLASHYWVLTTALLLRPSLFCLQTLDFSIVPHTTQHVKTWFVKLITAAQLC